MNRVQQWGETWERWVATNAAGLLFLGTLSIARGISYIPPMVNPHRPPTHFMESILNPPAWSVLWIMLGIACYIAAFVPRLLAPVIGVVVGIHAMWAVSFILATIMGDLPRAWVSSLGYVGIAGLTLFAFGRGKAGEIKIAPETR